MTKISDEFWEYSIDVVYGDEIYDYISNLQVDDCVKTELAGAGWDCEGSSIVLPDGNLFIWLSDGCGIGTIAHEAFHITRHILNNIQSIPLTDETEEVYARMVGSIVAKITG